jgi:serine/threonine-protein kinase
MSPEQGRGMPLDARSDLYALGVLAYEMLTNTVPFNDENPMMVIQMHREAAIPPMPDSVPYSMQMIVRRAMEKDPARRYQSSGEMMQHCQQVFAELNAGSVSVGGGGVPRTMFAPNAAQMQQQQPQPQYQQQAMGGLASQQPQYQQAGAQAKTMIAQQSPFAGGMPQQQPQQQPPPQGGNFVQASPMQKTIVAGMAPQISGGQFVQQQQQQHQPMHNMPPPPGAPNKTVLLQPTDGIVSVARSAMPPPVQTNDGASPLFWAVSLIIGIALGVVAYVIVLQV